MSACDNRRSGQTSQVLSTVLQTVPRLVSSDAMSFGRVGSDVSKDARVTVFRVKQSWAATFRDVGKQTMRPSPARRSTAPGPHQRRADVAVCRVPQETRHEDTRVPCNWLKIYRGENVAHKSWTASCNTGYIQSSSPFCISTIHAINRTLHSYLHFPNRYVQQHTTGLPNIHDVYRSDPPLAN